MPDSPTPITPARIAVTERAIRPYIRHTPVIAVDPASFGLPPGHLLFKLEQLQCSGSFKARGAFANLLLREIPRAGVIAASGGNHGAAVAYAARRLGVRASIFVPDIATPAKLARIRGYGAELIVGGENYAAALAASQARAEATGALQIHAYDSEETLLGQASLGRELAGQAQFDTLLVAVGGGGLIGGIAAWFAGAVKIIAVEPNGAPTLHAGFAAGAPTDVQVSGLAADSLGAKRVGAAMFPIARAYVDPQVLLVTDDEIRAAQDALWSELRLVAEPGGATAFAALLSGRYRPRPEERVAVLVCGGNTNPPG